MNRRFLFLGLAALAVVAILAFGFWGGGDWGPRDQVTRVVPGQNGETLVIQEGGHRGFFPFFPFFLIFPLFWIFVIGGLFSFFGRRRWGGGPGFGPAPDTREAWLADWHQRQHQASTNVMPPSNPAAPDAPASGASPEPEN
jgi:hypothetical protein